MKFKILLPVIVSTLTFALALGITQANASNHFEGDGNGGSNNGTDCYYIEATGSLINTTECEITEDDFSKEFLETVHESAGYYVEKYYVITALYYNPERPRYEYKYVKSSGWYTPIETITTTIESKYSRKFSIDVGASYAHETLVRGSIDLDGKASLGAKVKNSVTAHLNINWEEMQEYKRTIISEMDFTNCDDTECRIVEYIESSTIILRVKEYLKKRDTVLGIPVGDWYIVPNSTKIKYYAIQNDGHTTHKIIETESQHVYYRSWLSNRPQLPDGSPDPVKKAYDTNNEIVNTAVVHIKKLRDLELFHYMYTSDFGYQIKRED